MKNFKRVVIVTGGSHGIGRGIVQRFLADGWAVVNADIQRPKEAAGEFLRTDISREAAIRRCVAQTVKRFGQLDAVISNAGIADAETDFDVKAWTRILATNLTAAFLLAKYAEPHLKKAHGSFITIASTRALMSEPKTQAYSATKGGLVALTHSLAITLAPKVRVHCISPGWIHTGNEKLRPIDHQQHPVGRVGKPEDIADLAAFLVSPAASFITGQNYIVDGGMTRKMIYA